MWGCSIGALRRRAIVFASFMIFALASLGLVGLVGEDFFPNVDAGQIRLHVRAPAGTRIEETESRFAAVEQKFETSFHLPKWITFSTISASRTVGRRSLKVIRRTFPALTAISIFP